MSDIRFDFQEVKSRIQGGCPVQGTLEGYHRTSELLARVSHQVT